MSAPIFEAGATAPWPADRLADVSPAPLVLVEDHAIRYANAAFATLCGQRTERLVGRTFADVVHPHDRSHVVERLDEHQAGRVDTYRTQLRLLAQEGGEGRWVYATMVPVRVGGRPATLATAIDAQERRRAQDAVARSQRLDAVSRLAGGLAHRFNNTLQVILGHAERLAAALPRDHAAAASAHEIRRSAQRAAALTDQLLSLGQRQVLDPKPVDVGRLVSELKAAIEARLGPSIALVTRRGKAPAAAQVDAARFVHVLAALVDRAKAAMPSGGELAIETTVVTVDEHGRAERPWLRTGRFVRVTVSDSGAPLGTEAREHVFEPFHGGGGSPDLAVASAYGLIKQSQGFAWVEPGPAGGTCVVVLLPAAVSVLGQAAAVSGLRAVPPAASRTRVLVVEDDPSVRELLVETLQRNGFSVHAVGSAEEAMERRPDAFDVVLTDISLPGMNGVELARWLRRTAPAVTPLLMSGYAREEFLTTADDFPFIGKPFTSSAIVERLRAVIEARRPTRSESRPA
jgi:PAS domain S-box-containing protein